MHMGFSWPLYSGRPESEITADRKERIASENRALRDFKELQLSRERSGETPLATRVALWESRHGLAMPRDRHHPLIFLIARGTGLTVEQVLLEHQRRYADAPQRQVTGR